MFKVWDVLSNYEVIKTVASARKRSTAARMVVERAVRAWKQKYPCSKTDDCAVVCLFFKRPKPLLLKSVSQAARISMSFPESGGGENSAIIAETDDGLDTLLNYRVHEEGEDAAAAAGNGGEDSSGRHRRRARNRPIPS